MNFGNQFENYQETGIPENLELSNEQNKFDYLDEGDGYAQSEITPGYGKGFVQDLGRSEYRYQDDESIMLTE
jgi:hypothetical protein